MTSQPSQSNQKLKSTTNGCFIYTRVSTDRQADEGYSLEEQEKSCRELARRKGYQVLGVYREAGVSGTSINRPKFQQMLEKCSDDNGRTIKAIVVIHTDRFARNTLEHLMVKGILQKHNLQLISVLQSMLDDSPEGNLLDVILAGMNEFYSKDLGRKTARALTQKASEGWWPGCAPLGYINQTHPETRARIIQVDGEKAYYVREAFKRFAKGRYTVESLNDELYREGFRSRTGKKLQKSTLAYLLRRIFYTGKMKLKDKVYQGNHPPLTSMETYLQVQKVLDLHNHQANRTRKHSFLLSGLLFCGQCRGRLSGEKHVKKSGLVFDYYRCMGPKHNRKSCRQPFLPAPAIEKKTNKLFKNTTLAPAYLHALKKALEEIYQAQNQKDYSRTKTLENRRMGISRKMDKLEDLLLEDIVDRKRVADKYLQLKGELKSVEEQITQAKHSGIKLKKNDIEKILNFIQTLEKTYQSLDPDRKKLFLKLFIAKIFVREKSISGVEYTPVFQMIIEKDLVRISTDWLRIRDLIRTLEKLINPAFCSSSDLTGTILPRN